MLPYEMIAGGTFLVPATGADVQVSCIPQNPPDLIVCKAITGYGEANQAQSIEWWWERSMAQYTAKGLQQSSDATNPAITSKSLSTLGISHYDTSNPPTFTGLAATAINASTFVVLMANTGSIVVGDRVKITNLLGAREIAGYTAQVTAVTANVSITLGYWASAGLALGAAATQATIKKYIPNRYYPKERYIANITQAAQAVVSFTMPHDFTPGEIVSFRVGPLFGMKEINNVPARVLSVTNSSTVSSITINLDTSGFTAFTFPSDADFASVSPAVCVPSSSGVVPNSSGSATIPQEPPGTNLQDSFDNRNTRIINFGTGLFTVASFAPTVGDTWMWAAYKYSSYNNQ